MNILKVSYEYPPLGGGGGHVVAGLANQLAAMGHKIDLLTMKYKKLPVFERQKNFSIYRVACFRNSPVVCHPHEMMTYLCTALPAALRMVSKNRYDIIHAHFVFPDGIIAWLVSQRTGIPYIITTHGSDVPGYNPDRFVMMHKVLEPLWKSVVRSSSRIVCLSRFLETLLKRVLPSANTIIIPNGFQAGRFRTGRKKEKKILIVSRMFKRKGIQYFLKAVEGLVLDYEIHIVGDGPYLAHLKQQAHSLSLPVRFHGFVENDSDLFKELMEKSKIFVFPSESDNFPIVLLEAMDAGMAIITTRGTGCEEVVGDTALLSRPGDADGIKEALLNYTNDPKLCEHHGEMARRRLDENFSWEAVSKRYVAIYDQVMRK